MRSLLARITVASALFIACIAAAGCASDNGGATDAGTGGVGGMGGGGAGGSGHNDGAPVGDTGNVVCVMMSVDNCPAPMSFSAVQPIFQQRCASACHDGKTPDPMKPGETIWALGDYGTVFDWQGDVRDDLSHCTMPPADAGAPLTMEERIAILQWIKCGAKQ